MERQKRPQPSLLFYWETRVNGCLLPAMRDCCLRMYKEEQLLNERLSHAQAVTWRSWTSRERQESSARFPPFIPTRSAKTKKKTIDAADNTRPYVTIFQNYYFPPLLSLWWCLSWSGSGGGIPHTRTHANTSKRCFVFCSFLLFGEEKKSNISNNNNNSCIIEWWFNPRRLSVRHIYK